MSLSTRSERVRSVNHQWSDVVRWLAAHETFTYAFVSSFALALLRTRTPEAWVRLGERFPRLQGLVRVLRGLGVDPVKVLRGLAQLLEGNASERSAESMRVTDEPEQGRETSVPPEPGEGATTHESTGAIEDQGQR